MIKLDISKLKLNVYIRDPFLGCIAAATEFHEDNSIPTACTDGDAVSYNKEFLLSLTEQEATGIIAHEIGHIVLAHCTRYKQLNLVEDDNGTWNIAADYVVNNTLLKQGFSLPEGALECPDIYKESSTEEIYYSLMQDNEKKKQKMPDKFKDVKPGKNTPSMEDVKSVVYKGEIAAKSASKSFNHCNSDYGRVIDKLFRPTLNWRVLLRNFANNFKPSDYSWAKPNRRIQDWYMPSLCAEEACQSTVNVYIDASGSIDEEILGKFVCELKRLFEDLNLEKMYLNTFSDYITQKREITAATQLTPKLKFKSTGGTSIEEVVEDLNNSKSLFSIILTDGYYCQDPVECIKKKVFWVIYGNDRYKPTKGKVAHLN